LQQEESDVLARASEGLTSIRIVHAFGQEEYEVREFVREAKQSYAANLSLTITNAISSLADFRRHGARACRWCSMWRRSTSSTAA
jgi:ABC-type multidrug transport system fused ATPase/permease subunit